MSARPRPRPLLVVYLDRAADGLRELAERADAQVRRNERALDAVRSWDRPPAIVSPRTGHA
jgi:hypothetical protein